MLRLNGGGMFAGATVNVNEARGDSSTIDHSLRSPRRS